MIRDIIKIDGIALMFFSLAVVSAGFVVYAVTEGMASPAVLFFALLSVFQPKTLTKGNR